MRFLKTAAVLAALGGGLVGLTSLPATATPLAAGSLPAATSAAPDNPLVAQAQYRHHRRHYRHRHHPRRHWRHHYRGRIVCRVRPRLVRTPTGWHRRPVRICTRRG